MSYPFLKGHGTENDFVLLPDHDGALHGDLSAARVRALCDRRAGIGGDGVLRVIRTSAPPVVEEVAARTPPVVEEVAARTPPVVEEVAARTPPVVEEVAAQTPPVVEEVAARTPPVVEEVALRPSRNHPVNDDLPEWFLDYRNADGGVAEMCGNGIRVFARHLYDEGLVPPDEPVRIATRSGVKTVVREGDLFRADLGEAAVLGETKVSVGDRSFAATHVVVGNPHAVALVDDLAEAGSLAEEPAYDESLYPDGVNVEFVVRRGPGHVAMRVHERGSGETRSCGTGACAAALATAPEGPGRWQVDVLGGRLEVLRDDAGHVHLVGPAVIVARGETDL